MTRAPNPELPERILAEAEEIILEQGHIALNMRDLGRRVGVTATTIYHYFRSKEELLLRLKLRVSERLNRQIQTMPEYEDPATTLAELGRIYISFAETHPRFYRFLFETPLGDFPLSNSDRDVFYFTYVKARTALERVAQMGQLPVPPAYGAMMGWMMLHGFCSLILSGALQPAEHLETEKLKEIFMQMYAHGSFQHKGGGAGCS